MGAGFIQGVTPEQACIHFEKNCRAPKKALCKNIGTSDFTNLTVLNKDIDSASNTIQAIRSIAFYFDKNKALIYVMTVDESWGRCV
jgi:hypothetical protein